MSKTDLTSALVIVDVGDATVLAYGRNTTGTGVAVYAPTNGISTSCMYVGMTAADYEAEDRAFFELTGEYLQW